jgi:hypothetical protein
MIVMFRQMGDLEKKLCIFSMFFWFVYTSIWLYIFSLDVWSTVGGFFPGMVIPNQYFPPILFPPVGASKRKSPFSTLSFSKVMSLLQVLRMGFISYEWPEKSWWRLYGAYIAFCVTGITGLAGCAYMWHNPELGFQP